MEDLEFMEDKLADEYYWKKQIISDVRDVIGITKYKKYGLPKEKAQILAKAIVQNLSDNIERMFLSSPLQEK